MSEPKLRFKADDGSEFPEWESVFVKDLTLSHKQGYYTNEEYVDKGIKIARVSDLLNPDINFTDMPMVVISEKEYEMFKVSIGDFLIARSGSIGRYGIVTEIPDDTRVIFGSFIIKFNFNAARLNNRYFGEFYNSPFSFRQLLKITQAGANININAENIEKIMVPLPCIDEQKKIVEFFSAIDVMIKQTQSEIDAWKKQKRGVMQMLFSREVRFKADDGSEFPEWKEKTLGELGEFLKGAPLSKTDISDDGIPLILYGELYTTYSEVTYKVKRYTRAHVDEKHLSRRGDIVIPTSGETAEEISTATCVMVNGVVLAGDLNIYRTSDEIDGRIMSYLLNHQINNDIARIAQGKSIVHINANELKKLSVYYPNDFAEQQKIIACLTGFDDVIDKTKKELEAYRELKKGLLQQMFI